MIGGNKIPPGCIVRRARPTEKWTVINLMFLGVSGYSNPILTNAIFLLYTLVLFILGISFITTVFASFSDGSSLPIKVGIIALQIWSIINWAIFPNKLFNKSGSWLIESNGLVVGYGLISRHKTYLLLSRLYIVPTHRNQRLGSFLLKQIIEHYNNNKPLYLFCPSNLISFYQRFGFVSVSRKRLPLKIRFSLLPVLMLDKFVIITPISTQISILFS